MQASSGEPVTFQDGDNYYWACCSCGLTHFVCFKVFGKDKVEITMYRDDYRTDINRKRIKVKEKAKVKKK